MTWESSGRRITFGLLLILSFVLPHAIPSAQSHQDKVSDQKPNKERGQEVDPDDVIRITTTMVNSPVLIIGRNGKFVPTLRSSDFLVFEDGVQQDIAHFTAVEAPFTVAILIDVSRSTLNNLQDIQEAALAFVDKMRTNDRALVISFAEKTNVLSEPTSDHEVLKRAIRSCRPGGSSRIYDAISFALLERLNRIPGRTALIVFSDGVDNDSVNNTLEHILALIEKTRALVFPVQFSTYDVMEQEKRRTAPVGSGFSREDYLRADVFLHRAATISGTGVYPAQDISDLEQAVASISDELHNEYSIGYYPHEPISGNAEHRIEVRTRLPYLVVRARTSYSLHPSGDITRLSKTLDASESIDSSTGSIPVRRHDDQKTPEPNARWVCKGPNAPLDLVVVREAFSSLCPRSDRPNDNTNAWFVKRPDKIETMCKGLLLWQGKELAGAPIPIGYVVTAETSSPRCSKTNDPAKPSNAWVIKTADLTNTSCKGFPLPRGYVMVNEKFEAGCPTAGGSKNAWVIRRK